MNFLDEISEKSASCQEYGAAYIHHMVGLLKGLDLERLSEIAQVLARAREKGQKIFLVGNGGSAATASHFAQDLALGVRASNTPIFKTHCLTDSVSKITALGNDRSYAEVFRGQMEGMFMPGDVLLAFSASGNSENILKAVEYANNLGGITVGIIGFDGGKMKDLCKTCLQVVTGKGEYGPVESIHVLVAHILANFLASRTNKLH